MWVLETGWMGEGDGTGHKVLSKGPEFDPQRKAGQGGTEAYNPRVGDR